MKSDNGPSTSRKISLTPAQKISKRYSTKLTPKDFRGFIVPVFACFHDDEYATLNFDVIDRYAAWLKHERMQGICINTITGEGPALGFSERRLQVEAWWTAAVKHDLIAIVQIGGAPLPDVLQSAEHAEKLGVHAVLCLPELFYKPRKMEELVGYCRIVAKKCESRPFLYYHVPELTEINFDMALFCMMAEMNIPNFLGMQYTSTDLEIGARCLREGRLIMFGSCLSMAGASLLGFETFSGASLNVRPDLARAIVNAMNLNNLKLARERQHYLNELIRQSINRCETHQWVDAMKYWSNSEYLLNKGPGFSVGPLRKFFLKKTY